MVMRSSDRKSKEKNIYLKGQLSLSLGDSCACEKDTNNYCQILLFLDGAVVSQGKYVLPLSPFFRISTFFVSSILIIEKISIAERPGTVGNLKNN